MGARSPWVSPMAPVVLERLQEAHGRYEKEWIGNHAWIQGGVDRPDFSALHGLDVSDDQFFSSISPFPGHRMIISRLVISGAWVLILEISRRTYFSPRLWFPT